MGAIKTEEKARKGNVFYPIAKELGLKELENEKGNVELNNFNLTSKKGDWASNQYCIFLRGSIPFLILGPLIYSIFTC